MKELKNILNSKKGFILLYAILIMSILITLAVSITNITIKERQLSRYGEESLSAFFAAESGMECALYWDLKQEESSFRYDPTEPAGRSITCNGQTFQVGTTTKTIIKLNLVGSDNSSIIIVDKSVTDKTSLIAHGYSVEDPTGEYGVERGLRVQYGDTIDESDEQCDAFDLIFVLDNSGSISGAERGLLKDAAKKVVNKDENELAEDKFKMGVVSFGTSAELEVGLTTIKDDILNAINSLTFPGMTNIEGGLFVAKHEFLANGRDDAHNVVVIITDGATNQCISGEAGYDHDVGVIGGFNCGGTNAKNNAEAVATELHEQDVAVVAVGVGITASYANFLRQKIADRPDNYEKVDNFDDLDDLLKKFDCSYFMRAIGEIERVEI